MYACEFGFCRLSVGFSAFSVLLLDRTQCPSLSGLFCIWSSSSGGLALPTTLGSSEHWMGSCSCRGPGRASKATKQPRGKLFSCVLTRAVSWLRREGRICGTPGAASMPRVAVGPLPSSLLEAPERFSPSVLLSGVLDSSPRIPWGYPTSEPLTPSFPSSSTVGAIFALSVHTVFFLKLFSFRDLNKWCREKRAAKAARGDTGERGGTPQVGTTSRGRKRFCT